MAGNDLIGLVIWIVVIFLAISFFSQGTEVALEDQSLVGTILAIIFIFIAFSLLEKAVGPIT